MKTTQIFFLLIFIAPQAYGAERGQYDDAWWSGWGQGCSEAKVTSGDNNEIYVACCDDNKMSISLQNTLAYEFDILFTFNDKTSISIPAVSSGVGGIVADSKKGKENFEKLLQLFEKHNSVKVEYPDGKHATFTLKGSKAALEGCHL